MFKLHADGEAVRVQVKLGRSAVNVIEIVEGLAGRRPGDSFRHVDMGRSRPSEIELVLNCRGGL